jgi:phospholipase D
MAYSFSAEGVAQALIKAYQRGVDVKVILDRSQLGNRSKRVMLEQAGIPVLIDTGVAIAHNKVMIFDGQRVITGSYNYSEGAESRNAENLVIIDNKEVAAAYLNNWLSRQSIATTQKEMILNNDEAYPQE